MIRRFLFAIPALVAYVQPAPAQTGSISNPRPLTAQAIYDALGYLPARAGSVSTAGPGGVTFLLSGATTLTLPPSGTLLSTTGDGSGLTGLQGSATSFLQGGTGAVPRTLQDKAREQVSVLDFGAVCNGLADDRLAIQAAINATPFGSTLLFPPTQCAVSGANSTYALTASQPIIFKFQEGGGIKPLASVADTAAIIHLYGHASNFARTGFVNMFIGDNNTGTRYGGVGVVFDTTAIGPKYFPSPFMVHTTIMPTANGDWAVRIVNDQTNNPDGGTARAVFGPNNRLFGGVDIEKGGDSIGLFGSLVQSTVNPSVRVNLVNGAFGGAGNFYMTGMNVGEGGAGVVIDCAQTFQITSSEFEQRIASTNPNNVQIDVRGDECAIGQGVFTGNQMQANSGIGSPKAIRVDNAVGVVIDNNRIATPTDYAPIVITASATGAVIGVGNTFAGMTTPVSDSGSGTRYTLFKNGDIGDATGRSLALSGSQAHLSLVDTTTSNNPDKLFVSTGQTGTTKASNIVARFATQAAGRDTAIKLSDTVTNSVDLGMLAGNFYINGVAGLMFDLSSAGEITTSTWKGNVIAGQYGGTGVANTGKTITLAGNLATTGAFNTTFAQQATATFTLPASTDTLAGLGQAQTFTAAQTINTSGGAAPAALSGSVLRLSGNGFSRLQHDGVAGSVQYAMQRANGTVGSPTALQAADGIGAISAFGYGSTGYSGNRANITFSANENWSDSAQGTTIVFNVTPNGTATAAESVRFDGTGLKVASGKALQLGNAYVNTPTASTGYLLVTDSAGVVYEIPAKAH